MLSAKKSTLRKATPTSPTEWHQDGAFLGTGSRTVNAWVALTPCGIDAPGIDVFPQAFDHIVETGTDAALFDWSVSPEQADRVGSNLVSPVFAPGDALLFDQMTLHRSAIDSSMTRDRYAIESWFFAPSRFPYAQVPILF
jgi:ectoine hydroxylase-related dioxygenase (phytanoyl-CoA dioxygenase family)